MGTGCATAAALMSRRVPSCRFDRKRRLEHASCDADSRRVDGSGRPRPLPERERILDPAILGPVVQRTVPPVDAKATEPPIASDQRLPPRSAPHCHGLRNRWHRRVRDQRLGSRSRPGQALDRVGDLCSGIPLGIDPITAPSWGKKLKKNSITSLRR